MKHFFLIAVTVLLASVLLAAGLFAEVPHLIRFQGKVTDQEGAPLNGAYNITLRIYNAESAGELKWSEQQVAVPVNNGIFTVLLGSVKQLDLPFDQAYWLSMEVNNDGEMVPRQRISSVGYAIHAEVADNIAGVETIPKGAIILWRDSEQGCPVGYSRLAELDGKFLAAGSNYAAAAGGSNSHTHGAGTYQSPSHRHTVPNGPYGDAYDIDGHIASSRCVGGAYNNAKRISDAIYTDNQGPFSITGTSTAADSRPEFATVILCEKE